VESFTTWHGAGLPSGQSIGLAARPVTGLVEVRISGLVALRLRGLPESCGPGLVATHATGLATWQGPGLAAGACTVPAWGRGEMEPPGTRRGELVGVLSACGREPAFSEDSCACFAGGDRRLQDDGLGDLVSMLAELWFLLLP